MTPAQRPQPPTPPREPPHETRPLRNPRWLGWVASPRSALILVLAATTIRVLWLALFSQLTLSEDEAHYWLWAQNLDWSYYSKGPGVAWIIAASTAVFADTEFAVRLPAALAAAIGALAAADAARSVATKGSWKSSPVPDGGGVAKGDGGGPHQSPSTNTPAFVAAALYLVAPALAVTGFLTTIDAPYLACWMLAVALTLRATAHPSRRLWALVGLTLAIGFLFKYTILLLLPGILWVMWAQRARTRPAHLAALLLTAALGLLPVLLWNSTHDWATLRHLLGHLALAGGDAPPVSPTPITDRLLWPLEYLAFLLFIAGPIPMILLVTLLFRRFPLPERTGDTLRLTLPLAAFYLAVSLKAQTEANWAIAAPATLIPAASWAIVHGVRHNLWPIRVLWGITLFTGLATWGAILTLGARPDLPYPDAVPTNRVSGMREHAQAVQAEFDRLGEQTGLEPFIVATHYGHASQLAFYLDNHPTVYCISAHTGGRRTQFNLWPHADLDNPQTQRALVARPALALGGHLQTWVPAFEAVGPLGPLNADPKPHRISYLVYGYRGVDSWTPWYEREGWNGKDAPPDDLPAILPPRTPAIPPRAD